AAVLHAGEEPVWPEGNLLHFGRAGQRGEDDFALRGECFRAVGPHRAGREMALGGGAPDVVDDEFVSRLLQIGRHAGAHRAEPDKTDFHLRTPLLPLTRRAAHGAHYLPSGATVLGLDAASALPLPACGERVGVRGYSTAMLQDRAARLPRREDVLGDLRRGHRRRPAGLESEMRDDLADLLLGDAVVQRSVEMAGQLPIAAERDQSRDDDQAAVALLQA